MEVNEPGSLFANLGCGFTSDDSCRIVSLPTHQSTNELWKEIVKHNLDPEAPCLIYFEGRHTDDNINIKVVCKPR